VAAVLIGGLSRWFQGYVGEVGWPT
jgi:hypothetical protein